RRNQNGSGQSGVSAARDFHARVLAGASAGASDFGYTGDGGEVFAESVAWAVSGMVCGGSFAGDGGGKFDARATDRVDCGEVRPFEGERRAGSADGSTDTRADSAGSQSGFEAGAPVFGSAIVADRARQEICCGGAE